MESVREQRQCQWPRCPGEQVLTEKPTRVKPKQLDTGETFRGRTDGKVWMHRQYSEAHEGPGLGAPADSGLHV